MPPIEVEEKTDFIREIFQKCNIQHEHKIAVAAYYLSLMFDDVFDA